MTKMGGEGGEPSLRSPTSPSGGGLHVLQGDRDPTIQQNRKWYFGNQHDDGVKEG